MSPSGNGNGSTPPFKYEPGGKLIYHLMAFMEGYDLQIYPVCLRTFEQCLKMSPSTLSTIATVDNMSLLGSAFFWGFLSDKFQCQYLYGIAAMLAGVANILLASTSNYHSILALRVCHGLGVGAVNAAQPKIISSSEKEDTHPVSYGIIQAVTVLGRLLSAILTTFAASNVILGVHGWRMCYAILGYVWIFIGSIAVLGMKPKGNNGSSTSGGGGGNGEGDLSKLGGLFKKTTTYFITLVVYVSEVPFVAFTYMMLYLQYNGVSDMMAGVALAVTLIGAIVGAGGGGKAIGAIPDEYKGYGLLGSGIFALAVRFIIGCTLFMGPKPNGRMLWFHFVEFFILGATLVTIGSVDRTVISDIAEDGVKATASALIRSVAGIASSLTLYPLAGRLSEKAFGYIPTTDDIDMMDETAKATNCNSLRQTIMYILLVGTAINIILYGFCMISYKSDKGTNGKGKK
ncbi:Major Facilitator Superfamily protein [Babesia bovis T2Bo]|uniref:Major Facilitator Superfamily protein n=1 Tax=Babesia bovis T2Bo TaxID=484906 RepID=UPI001C34EA10|nr:Major Facilitator Superfamily protein [Babesia bovis T2Bo]KAG6440106.1 Major Facilitator Superfamily protein [Babesia bovis T2Bo]